MGKNSQLGAAVSIDYTKVEANLSTVMLKNNVTTRTHGAFALNRSLAWTEPSNIVQNQLTDKRSIRKLRPRARNFSS